MTELLIGCGIDRQKKLALKNTPADWTNLVTLDRYPDCNPDILHDLESLPYPFSDEEFDEIHAYCILEHTGTQGDWQFFFDQFQEFHRILKPYGFMYIISPKYSSNWAWGDPGHKRIIGIEQMGYLNQLQYDNQVGKSSMTDYRWYYTGNFTVIKVEDLSADMAAIALQKVAKEEAKPAH